MKISKEFNLLNSDRNKYRKIKKMDMDDIIINTIKETVLFKEKINFN
jgi:hypothetical protein